ncbi:hypothetical protein [Streptomyces sviceus]|uniref:hypothetical protein n=1 Tax=Streptomyces sviceus TaxID=285530 RepID=UPI0036E88EF2
MANPGYGKRSAPERPRTAQDFADLPPREAAIAAYVDRLPDGADISVKTLAKQLPYGQCALRTALNRLQQAGHLRRGRERLDSDTGGSRWITRSWVSRTARNDEWWAAYHPAALLRRRLTDKIPPEPPAPKPPRRILECAECGVLGRPEALPGGLCKGCRGEPAPTRPTTLPTASEIRARADDIRAAMSLKREEGAPV